MNASICTVKVDAAHRAFSAFGESIVWAVVDSGIDERHGHFAMHANLDLSGTPLRHRDFTGMSRTERPLTDARGHGTHVAGIIAGEMRGRVVTARTYRDETGGRQVEKKTLSCITGMAPRCKLVSLKVLNDQGGGSASAVMAAIQYVQEVNGYGRRVLIHGVNLSLGYPFDPEWFACGQSPLCTEVNRLAKSGVVVTVAAGNSGYGSVSTKFQGTEEGGIDLTINDPGNADLAITVGSTHRDQPHTYGVSYFSSKGPTGDGRMKPDLLAPGEKILSCLANTRARGARGRRTGEYGELSGTSMAAPHVAGAIAAFLSIRPEYIGQPEEVKRIFLAAATDLGRTPAFQGRGLVDIMRAIQSV